MAIIDLFSGAKKISLDLTDGMSCGSLGAGIYLCDKTSAARELACRDGGDGYVSKYELDLRGLKVLDLCERKHGILPWLALLLKNRKFAASPAAKARARAIIEQSLIDTEGYDVIIGFRHDGSAFSALRAYLEGDISTEKLESAVGGRGCPKQILLRTDKAIAAIKFIAYTSVKANSYYSRSIYRDSELRKECFGTVQGDAYAADFIRNLSEAMDYAAGALAIPSARFIEMLCTSGIIDRLDAREPAYVCGMSGTELAIEAAGRIGIKKTPSADADHTEEYTLGELLAKYSVERGVSLRSIANTVKPEQLCSIDRTDSASFFAKLDAARASIPARLQEQRKLRGISQRELAEAAGVNLRTLQQYELKTKDINKAAATAVLSLARVLGCTPEDILEL